VCIRVAGALCAFTAYLAAAAMGQPGTVVDPATGKPVQIGAVFDVELVMVPVALRGAPPGERLPREAFTLKVDGKPHPFESFENDSSAPLSLIFLQDLSGSMAEPDKLEASRQVLDCFLDTAQDNDEQALSTFASGQTQVEVPLTRDLSAIRESMETWEPWGTTGLYDAVAMLPEISLDSSGVKRAAVLVTDGIDNVSEMSPGEAAALVQSAQLPVYVFALPSQEELPEDDGIVRYSDLLQQLATATGGQYHALDAPADARRICSIILRELRSQYVLGFSVSGTGPSSYHSLSVEVTGRNKRTSVIHRRGYRGTAPNRPNASP
jgi:VWFA-related protein